MSGDGWANIRAIEAEVNVLDERFDTPDEQKEDHDRFHDLLRVLSRERKDAGLCARQGCFNPREPQDEILCADDLAFTVQIVAELRAEGF